MKVKLIFIVCCLIISVNSFCQEIIYPKTVFDTAAAKAALQTGSSNIEGVAYWAPKNGYGIKNKSKTQYAANTIVDLYPMTAYIEEWNKMRTKVRLVGAPKRIKMSDQAASYSLYVKTDADGNFKFTKMKPGKYLLITTMTWITDYYNNYTGESFSNDTNRSFYKVVEINTDGSTEKVKLTN